MGQDFVSTSVSDLLKTLENAILQSAQALKMSLNQAPGHSAPSGTITNVKTKNGWYPGIYTFVKEKAPARSCGTSFTQLRETILHY